jgi:hypothetical protein
MISRTSRVCLLLFATAAAASGTNLVTSVHTGNARTANGWFGVAFTVGSTPLTVSSLGRYCINGNTATHTVKLTLQTGSATGTDVSGGSATVAMSGCTAGQFAYMSIPPVTLAAGSTYYLTSLEASGGDTFYDQGYTSSDTSVVLAGAVTIAGAPTNATNGGTYWSLQAPPSGNPNDTYGPVDLTFTTGSSSGGSGTPLITGQSLGNVRTDSAAQFLGMKFTVGSTAMTVSQLGRWCVAGNTQTHIVKLVTASSGADFTGGSVSINTQGCTGSQYQYAALSPSVTLAANTAYLLVSQEFANSDQFYDYSPVTSTSAAVVNDAEYSAGIYYGVGAPGYSYGPVNLMYTLGSGSGGGGSTPPTVTFTSPASGATLTANGTATATAQATSPNTIAKVQFFVDSQLIGTATASPYTATISVATWGNGNHTLTAVATDSAGNPSTTASVTFTVNVSSGSGSGGTPTPLLASYNPAGGTLRNDFSSWVGMQITIGPSDEWVSALGRLYIAGNNHPHAMKLVDSAGNDVAGSAATVTLPSGSPGNFVYTNLATPIKLLANQTYYLVSQETNGGDQWYDYQFVLVAPTSGSAIVVNGPAYYAGQYWLVSQQNQTYVPVSLMYNAVAPGSGGGGGSTGGSGSYATPPDISSTKPPLFTGFDPSSGLRNNYTGWVGTQFTVASQLKVECLGRMVIAGNTQTHAVKLVNAATGQDVAGGSVNIATATAAAGSFAYAPLPANFVLPAGSYYLVSYEYAGEQFYDLGNVTPSGIATINGGVYFGYQWQPVGSANQTYGPVNLIDDAPLDYTDVKNGWTTLSDEEYITALYEVTLGFAPDVGGWSYWESQLAANTTDGFRLALIDQFLRVTDGTNTNYCHYAPTQTTSAFVTCLYVNAFARQPDSSGGPYWNMYLDPDTNAARQQVVSFFVNSSEIKPRVQQTTGQLQISAGANNSPGVISGMQTFTFNYTNLPSNPFTIAFGSVALNSVQQAANGTQYTLVCSISWLANAPSSPTNNCGSYTSPPTLSQTSQGWTLSVTINAAALPASPYTFDATVDDLNGATLSLLGAGSFTVGGTASPTVALASSTAGTTATFTATALAASGLSIAKVTFFVDGSQDATMTAAPYVLTKTFAGGSTHSVYALATDSATHTGTSSTISVTVGTASISLTKEYIRVDGRVIAIERH